MRLLQIPLRNDRRRKQDAVRKDALLVSCRSEGCRFEGQSGPHETATRRVGRQEAGSGGGDGRIRTRALARKHSDKHDNDNTYSKYRTVAKYIGLWARLNGLVRLRDISADTLDVWKNSWTLNAKRPEDRIGRTTAARRLEMVKRFTKYCLRMAWIVMDPAGDFDAITPDTGETLPLLSGRYEAVLAATYEYDAGMRPDDGLVPSYAPSFN